MTGAVASRIVPCIRLIEAPKDRLRVIQQRILHGILERIPPHPAATGFRRGTSLLDYVAPHGGRSLRNHPDFPAYLRGRVAWLTQLNPDRGAKLLALFKAFDHP